MEKTPDRPQSEPETKTYESDEEYLSRITADLKTSREVIYKYTGIYPDILSFPFGSYNKKALNAGKSVGFKYFITTQPGYNKENSKFRIVYRIRSGDAALTSSKLMKSIIDCANDVKKG
jgi:biofilm PGA synthesis lipoprotein PgaB